MEHSEYINIFSGWVRYHLRAYFLPKVIVAPISVLLSQRLLSPCVLLLLLCFLSVISLLGVNIIHSQKSLLISRLDWIYMLPAPKACDARPCLCSAFLFLCSANLPGYTPKVNRLSTMIVAVLKLGLVTGMKYEWLKCAET
jgi:hypothetical protein